jgi:hypothetical protein
LTTERPSRGSTQPDHQDDALRLLTANLNEEKRPTSS